MIQQNTFTIKMFSINNIHHNHHHQVLNMPLKREQGAWTRWEGVTELKFTWEDLWKTEPVRLQFLLKFTYDLLLTPSNLVPWNKKEDAACAPCKVYANPKHILSRCKVALTRGRYRWRHDQVLGVKADSIEKLRRGKQKGILLKPLSL